ncbi:MAG: thioesterase family protein [Planctomycetota bacterium]
MSAGSQTENGTQALRTHKTEVRVRYADTDQGGVVYNANYLVFLEIGRTELMRSIGCPYAELEARGLVMPVFETQLKFRSPAVYDDLLVVATELTELGRVRMRFDSKVMRASDRCLLAEGYVRLACTNGKGKPVAIPADALALMKQHLLRG